MWHGKPESALKFAPISGKVSFLPKSKGGFWPPLLLSNVENA
jgi:hypothetical protein